MNDDVGAAGGSPGAGTGSSRPRRASIPGGVTPRLLRFEVAIVICAFPLAWAVDAAAARLGASGGRSPTPLPVIFAGDPGLSAALLVLVFLTGLAPVPLVAYLLLRSSESLASIGLRKRFTTRDAGAAVLLASAMLGFTVATAPMLQAIAGPVPGWAAPDRLPAYFIVPAIAAAITAALAEEVVVTGYLLHRLDQLGWSRRRALWASVVIRAVYHAYYGVWVLPVILTGLLFAWYWQRTRRLGPIIVAHMAYDGLLLTALVLTS